MEIIAALLVLFLAVFVVLAGERIARFVPIAAGVLILPAIGALLFLFNAPSDFMIRFPRLGPILDPKGNFIFYAFGALCGVSLMVGYILRYIYQVSRKPPTDSG